VNLAEYRAHRARLKELEPQYRTLCTTCFQPPFGCYCRLVRPFDPKIRFVILIHPIEVKRRIATGRMSHLCLENSRLIQGKDYSDHPEVNEILQDPKVHSVMLYPGPTSTNLTPLSAPERAGLFPREKELAIFVIDGTWATARKMVRSRNLAALPRICFTPETPSTFRVRKQPAPGCYSTLEAIHRTIEILGESRGYDLASRQHDALLTVFDHMVEKQIACVKEVKTTRQATYRREQKQKKPFG
jgi:DTW domain-containing protein YfiP